MARISASEAGGSNVLAFLDMIAWSEIGPAMLAKSDDGYNVLVGSTPDHMTLFHTYNDHPNIYVESVDSTAAGRYQILRRYWKHYKAQLHLTDFGPENQDRYAIQQLRERTALPLILAGDIAGAIARARNIWASLPGAGYGQHEHKLDNLIAAYVQAGGMLA